MHKFGYCLHLRCCRFLLEPKLDPGAPKPEGTTTKPSIGDPIQVRYLDRVDMYYIFIRVCLQKYEVSALLTPD